MTRAVVLASALSFVARPRVAAQLVSPDPHLDALRTAIETGAELSDRRMLDSLINAVDRAIVAKPDDSLLRHYYAYALFRAGAVVLGRDGSGKSCPYFDRARKELETLTRGATLPETYAVLSAVYGMQIASGRVQAIAAMQLGPKSNAMADRARELAPNNPRVWLVRGIGAFNSPKVFGGGMASAERYLRRALELYATDNPPPPLPSWGAAEAHIWLGRVYTERGFADSASAEFRAALVLQPRNSWVLQTLLSEKRGR